MDIKFRSKIGSIFLVVFLFIFGLMVYDYFTSPHWIAFVVALPVLIYTIYIFSTTVYLFENTYLLIRSGMFKKRIRIGEIREVKEMFDISNAPALSTDRLLISWAKESIFVSPKKKHEFIEHLKDANPNIKVIYK